MIVESVVPGDAEWMELAVGLAALGEGTTSPNPRVGCVVVRDGRAVGHGYHRRPGGPHAEAIALERAGDRARGATLFVNLEPCAHFGRTPPCTRRIVDSGVRRVVAAVRDPNPLVDGAGFRALRESGIEVDEGPCRSEAVGLNASFFHWHATGRPRVTLKLGVSLDGRVAAKGGASRWITSEAARRFTHRLRARHDAILVGAGTVRRDDPRLDARVLRGPGGRLEDERSPLRVVVSGSGRLAPSSRVFEEGARGRSRLYVPAARSPELDLELAARVEVVAVPPAAGGVDLLEVVRDLGRVGVQSLLVEGGGTTAAAFVDAQLVDEVAWVTAPVLLGSEGAKAALERDAFSDPGSAPILSVRDRFALGPDIVTFGAIRPRREEVG